MGWHAVSVCELCALYTTRHCQVCRRVVCAPCSLDHTHGLDDAFPTRDDER